jgi:hypothetical protein
VSAFAEWQPRYAEQGIATFPVRAKRPMVKGYLRVGSRVSGQLALKFPAAEAFGLACRLNRIAVLDVDAPDERLLADALAEFGPTPFVVRSGSGNYQAWYRNGGEPRKVRPDPDRPIDILGDGFVVCPPSLGSKGRYTIIQGRLDDLRTLPMMHHPVEAAPTSAGDLKIGKGKRNDSLWRWCMAHVGHCGSIDELLEEAMQASQTMFYEPLPDEEVLRIVASAWKIERSGKNRFGSSRVIIDSRELDKLIGNSDAFMLLAILRQANWQRDQFFIANEMHRKLGWSRKRLARARDRLIELEAVHRVRRASGWTGPALFQFKR